MSASRWPKRRFGSKAASLYGFGVAIIPSADGTSKRGAHKAGILWAALLSAVAAPSAGYAAGSRELLIRDVTLISPERAVPLAHADVLIDGSRIVKVGHSIRASHARIIDGKGRFLIPGLIDSHVHTEFPAPFGDDVAAARSDLLASYRAQLPRAYLAFGYTTLIDLAFDARTYDWWNAAPQHPHLLNCGPGLRVAGGYGAQHLPNNLTAKAAADLVYEPNAAAEWPKQLNAADFTPSKVVDRVARSGAICLKVYVESGFGIFNWPVPSVATLTALHAQAQRHGLPMIVHANSVDAWREALAAKSEIIAHGLWQWPGDRANVVPPPEARAVIRRAARLRIEDQPTLETVYGEASVFDRAIVDDPRYAIAIPRKIIAYLHGPEAAAARQVVADRYLKNFSNAPQVIAAAGIRASATLRLIKAAGIRLLFGTDTPAEEGDVGNPPGLNGRLEMQHWADDGIPLRQILSAATLENARAFGLARDRGSIEAGKRADLVLLSADPLKDVSAYDKIVVTILDGRPISRDSLRPAD
jgi:imidazolonepropionase-like amidohydrolase